MTSSVVVTDNFIRCPHCKAKINIVQHKSNGAVYARGWTNVNMQQLQFLKIWLDSGFGNTYITKRGLHKKLLSSMKKSGLSGFILPINFAARVSELVSAGTDYNDALVEKVGSVLSLNKDPITGPFYILNTNRLSKVLKHGGKLD